MSACEYSGGRFPDDERRVLILAPRLGTGVVSGLEQAGFGSFQRLRQAGVERAMEAVEAEKGLKLHNRVRALQRAIEAQP